jgi:hypothetical protein
MDKLAPLNLGGLPPNGSSQWVMLQAEAKRRDIALRTLKSLCERLEIEVIKQGKFNWTKSTVIDEALNCQVSSPKPSINTLTKTLRNG